MLATAACFSILAFPAPRALAQRAREKCSALLQSVRDGMKVPGPCGIEIPWLMDFDQAYGKRDFVVLGVSVDEDGWKAVRPYIEAKKVTYPVMVTTDEVTALYGGVNTLPMTLLIDRTGRIVARHEGLVSKSDYKAEIEALLTGR